MGAATNQGTGPNQPGSPASSAMSGTGSSRHSAASGDWKGLIKPQKVSAHEEEAFIRSFLNQSYNQKREYRQIDIEVLENYMVLPFGASTAHPDNAQNTSDTASLWTPGNVYSLKDPETHAMIETLLSKLLLGMLGDQGFVSAMPIGFEDAFAANSVGALLERVFRINGNYRATYVCLKDALMWGASVLAPSWIYESSVREEIVTSIDPITGMPMTESVFVPYDLSNDIQLEPIDIDDFYPDPGADTMIRMTGAARRYWIPAYKAWEFAESDRWDKEQVKKAMRSGISHGMSEKEDYWRAAKDRPINRYMIDDVRPMVAFEYWGDTPYLCADGVRRRRITLLNGVRVESRPSPIRFTRKIPFFDFVINPINGRWRGIAPGQIARFTQSFTDAVMICLAEAAVRATSPPVVYADGDMELDLELLKEWRGPIPAENINNVKELRYDPNLQAGNALYGMLKSTIQQSSGVNAAMQTGDMGSKRITGTEAQMATQQMMSRPQVAMSLFEREAMPDLGQACLQLYQDFLETDDDVLDRIGKHAMQISDAAGLETIRADFDIKFIGSSQMASKREKFEILERVAMLFANIPGAAAQFPWAPAMMKMLELADQDDLEAMVNDPESAVRFLMMTQAAGQQKGMSGQSPMSGNGANMPNQQSPGMLPAESSGAGPV